jgi:hypothetical protein
MILNKFFAFQDNISDIFSISRFFIKKINFLFIFIQVRRNFRLIFLNKVNLIINKIIYSLVFFFIDFGLKKWLIISLRRWSFAYSDLDGYIFRVGFISKKRFVLKKFKYLIFKWFIFLKNSVEWIRLESLDLIKFRIFDFFQFSKVDKFFL